MLGEASLSRSEQRNLEFKRRISDAAVALFIEFGVHETPVTAIIKKAGIAHKTFFNHFPSKQHLISYMSCEYANGLLNLTMDASQTPFESLEQGFMQMAAQLETLDDSLVDMLSTLLISVPTGPEDVVEKQTKQLTEGLRELLTQAERMQQLQPGFSVDAYADMISGIFINTVINWAGQKNYPLQNKMTTSISFIRRSVFILQ